MENQRKEGSEAYASSRPKEGKEVEFTPSFLNTATLAVVEEEPKEAVENIEES